MATGLFNSGLYTEAELQARLSYRLNLFAKLTGCLASTANHLVSVADQRDYTLDDKAIDVTHVAFEDADGDLQSVYPGSIVEADSLLSNAEDSAASPELYNLELGDVNNLSLLPPPNAGSRVIHLTYTRRPTALPADPTGTTIDLPNDFTPFVKYGALADIFNKAGETYDPMRGAICEELFQLGAQTVNGWVHGELAATK